MITGLKNFGETIYNFEGHYSTKAIAQREAEESRKKYGMNARVVKIEGKWCVYSSEKFTKKQKEEMKRIERRLTAYGR